LAIDRIYLVSCVSKKSQTAAPARELYVSPWFRAARRYVEASGDPWFILSAKHGLISPAQAIAPYDETLNKMTIGERRAWAARVMAQMDEIVPASRAVVVFGGIRYREFLMEHLERRASVEVPMKGLGIGKQLQWLNQHTAHESTH
jgi:hypothetical protein